VYGNIYWLPFFINYRKFITRFFLISFGLTNCKGNSIFFNAIRICNVGNWVGETAGSFATIIYGFGLIFPIVWSGGKSSIIMMGKLLRWLVSSTWFKVGEFDSLKRKFLTVWKGNFWQFEKEIFDSLTRKILTVWKKKILVVWKGIFWQFGKGKLFTSWRPCFLSKFKFPAKKSKIVKMTTKIVKSRKKAKCPNHQSSTLISPTFLLLTPKTNSKFQQLLHFNHRNSNLF
jgi:hypothetical protein